MHIDRVNQKILQILETDGRIRNADLAERVGMSQSACLRRVQELERRGVIEGYRARINRVALGTGIVAFVGVGLSEHDASNAKAFESAVCQASEVREVHNVAGNIEYLLRVETADLKTFKSFHSEVLGALPHVRSITSYICLDSPKDQRA